MSTDPRMTEEEWLSAATVSEHLADCDHEILLDRMLRHLNAEGLKDVERMQALRKRIEALDDSYRIHLNFLSGCGVNERKLRLFGCACCRNIWQALTDERCRRGVEVAERLADGQATDEERRQAQKFDPREAASHETQSVLRILGYVPSITDIGIAVDNATHALYDEQLRSRGFDINREVPDDEIDGSEEYAVRNREAGAQLKLLIDIFGNPFRPVTWDDRFRTPAIVGLAREMYDERSFARMPVLADMLAAAGCNDESILAHCRSDGPHVRGCWVVDLILRLN
jgi:hypothetical protein